MGIKYTKTPKLKALKLEHLRQDSCDYMCIWGGGGDMSVGVWKMCKTIFVLGPVIKIILKKKKSRQSFMVPF